MKTAAIIFHKNIHNYPSMWIEKCVESIKNQTYKKFGVFEIDYGGGETQIYPGSNFRSGLLANHAEAHNYLLDIVFNSGYEYAFNVNIDDFYDINRFERQLVYARKGYDVISSNFYNIDENGRVKDIMIMHDKNIIAEANRNINILAHPVICYSRKFWTTCSRLNPEEIPVDDFNLWKRSFEKYKFVILPDFLLFYRVHASKISGEKTGDKPHIKKDELWAAAHNAKREEWLKNN